MNKILQNNKSRAYGGESAEQRRARRKKLFLDAGLNLFGTIGYRATTVRALCKEAGLTDRYFYESFENTEALLIAVYKQCVGGLEQSVEQAIVGLLQQPKRDAAHLIHEVLDIFFAGVEDPRIVRVCWLEV